jgi:hypothetical protein
MRHSASVMLKLLFLLIPGNILSMKMTLYHKRYVKWSPDALHRDGSLIVNFYK